MRRGRRRIEADEYVRCLAGSRCDVICRICAKAACLRHLNMDWTRQLGRMPNEDWRTAFLRDYTMAKVPCFCATTG